MTRKVYTCPNCQANVRSSKAFVRHLLEEAGPHGVTTNDFLRAGAGSRFGARIFDLRHKHGIHIEETSIDGGSVYKLAAQPSGHQAAADAGMAAEPARIPVHRGQEVVAWATVDAADAGLSRYFWRLSDRGYVIRSCGSGHVRMHRSIMGVSDPETLVDHINRDRLDNRRENLRIVTRQGNAENRSPRKRSASGIRGVSWAGDRWRAEVCIDGHKHFLGYYADKEEAGAVASAFRAKHMQHAVEPSSSSGSAAGQLTRNAIFGWEDAA